MTGVPFHGGRSLQAEIVELFSEAQAWEAWRGHTPLSAILSYERRGVTGIGFAASIGGYTFAQGVDSELPWGDASRCGKRAPTKDRKGQKETSRVTVAVKKCEERLRAGERPKSWGKHWRAAAKKVGIRLARVPDASRNYSWREVA